MARAREDAIVDGAVAVVVDAVADFAFGFDFFGASGAPLPEKANLDPFLARSYVSGGGKACVTGSLVAVVAWALFVYDSIAVIVDLVVALFFFRFAYAARSPGSFLAWLCAYTASIFAFFGGYVFVDFAIAVVVVAVALFGLRQDNFFAGFGPFSLKAFLHACAAVSDSQSLL